jgi:hypothetical protein
MGTNELHPHFVLVYTQTLIKSQSKNDDEQS